MDKDASKDSKAPVRVWLVQTGEELSEDMLTTLHVCLFFYNLIVPSSIKSRAIPMSPPRIDKGNVRVDPPMPTERALISITVREN